MRQLSDRRLAGEVLFRVFRSGRASPWWFASRSTTAPDQAGRFDLVSPEGTCYLATLPEGAALWAGQDRALPQSWADALRRAGWQALLYGMQHDPAGQLRGVAFFDFEGEHAPYGDETWTHTILRLDDDPAILGALEEHGIEVIADPEPDVVALDDSGLL